MFVLAYAAHRMAPVHRTNAAEMSSAVLEAAVNAVSAVEEGRQLFRDGWAESDYIEIVQYGRSNSLTGGSRPWILHFGAPCVLFLLKAHPVCSFSLRRTLCALSP